MLKARATRSLRLLRLCVVVLKSLGHHILHRSARPEAVQLCERCQLGGAGGRAARLVQTCRGARLGARPCLGMRVVL